MDAGRPLPTGRPAREPAPTRSERVDQETQYPPNPARNRRCPVTRPAHAPEWTPAHRLHVDDVVLNHGHPHIVARVEPCRDGLHVWFADGQQMVCGVMHCVLVAAS